MWGTFELSSDDGELLAVHVIPIDADDKPAAGHEAKHDCFCGPSVTTAEGLDFKSRPMYKHHEYGWPGSNELQN